MGPQGIPEIIADFKKRYEEVVKPAIEKKDYSTAYAEVLNIWGEIQVDCIAPQIRKYGSGANFLVTLLCLQKGLERLATKGEGSIDHSTRRFLEELSNVEVSVRNRIFSNTPATL